MCIRDRVESREAVGAPAHLLETHRVTEQDLGIVLFNLDGCLVVLNGILVLPTLFQKLGPVNKEVCVLRVLLNAIADYRNGLLDLIQVLGRD